MLITEVMAIIFAVGGPAAIIIIAIIMQYKKKRKYYESLVKALELGKNAEEIKEIFAIEKQQVKRNGIGFLRGGIIVVGIGIGLFAIGRIVGEVGVYASAAFVSILGLALIIVYYLTRQKGKAR